MPKWASCRSILIKKLFSWRRSFLFTKNKLLRNFPGSDFTCWIAPFLNISFLNLFVTFPPGSPLLIGEDHTEMGSGRKEFWNPLQWTKYLHLELIFLNFLNKILVFLAVEPVSLWHGEGFWPKDVLLICLHAEVVECSGKVILLLLPCCLCVCGTVLMKKACGTPSNTASIRRLSTPHFVSFFHFFFFFNFFHGASFFYIFGRNFLFLFVFSFFDHNVTDLYFAIGNTWSIFYCTCCFGVCIRKRSIHAALVTFGCTIDYWQFHFS